VLIGTRNGFGESVCRFKYPIAKHFACHGPDLAILRAFRGTCGAAMSRSQASGGLQFRPYRCPHRSWKRDQVPKIPRGFDPPSPIFEERPPQCGLDSWPNDQTSYQLFASALSSVHAHNRSLGDAGIPMQKGRLRPSRLPLFVALAESLESDSHVPGVPS
jgi:hypothetical protein